MKTIGEFTYDGKQVSGPARYMDEQGSAKLDSICSGDDPGFNAMLAARPDVDLIQMVLVALQTNYAGWKGIQPFLAGGSK